MAFVPQSAWLITSRPCSKPFVCTPRRPRTAPPDTPTATARPLRAATAAAVVPVLANRRQVMSRLGPPSAILDRVFVSLLLLLLLHLFPLFPAPLSSLFRLFLLLGPVGLPWARATRANASLRRSGRFVLLSAPFRARRVGEDEVAVEVRCEESGMRAGKTVKIDDRVLEGSGVAHALCTVRRGKVQVVEVVADGRRLVGCESVREGVLSRICSAAARGV